MTKKTKFEAMTEEFQNLVCCWPYPNVCHKDIEDFSNGALSRSRLADLCSAGEGPPTFKIMRKNASDIVEMAFWLYSRSNKNSKGKAA